MNYNCLTISMNSKYVAACYLTAKQELAGLSYPVKRKQALLGSNLSGIAGAEKSRKHGTRSSDRVPTHHFGPYLRKPRTTNERYFLSGHDYALITKKACQISAIVKVWHRYVRSYVRY